jgi:molecular chaperone GrpE (heat shock protein)
MSNEISKIEQTLIENLRVIAELKNELNKKEEEKQDMLREFALNIIDVLDSFERIEESLIEKGIKNVQEGETAISRFSTIYKKLISSLSRQGVTKIEFPDNRLIVGLCEVIDTEPDINRRNEEIVAIVRNGYIRGKILIRSAQVIVVKN